MVGTRGACRATQDENIRPGTELWGCALSARAPLPKGPSSFANGTGRKTGYESVACADRFSAGNAGSPWQGLDSSVGGATIAIVCAP